MKHEPYDMELTMKQSIEFTDSLVDVTSDIQQQNGMLILPQ